LLTLFKEIITRTPSVKNAALLIADADGAYSYRLAENG
jgi:hypothetical protein